MSRNKCEEESMHQKHASSYQCISFLNYKRSNGGLYQGGEEGAWKLIYCESKMLRNLDLGDETRFQDGRVCGVYRLHTMEEGLCDIRILSKGR